MRSSALFLSLLVATAVNAHPFELSERAVSPDGTCGGAKGYICPSSASCCSQWGWCGSMAEYCTAGCQSAFGTCSTSPTPTSSSRPATTSTSTSRSSTPSPNGGVRGVARSKIGSVPYGQIITTCIRSGDIALTFDDGPSIYTGALLDLLARYSVKATFFVLGNGGLGELDRVQSRADLLRRTYALGHQIASHTWTHADLTTISSAARREEMYLTEQAITNVLGFFPTYMRTPYLAYNADVGTDMAALGYHVISTNLDPRDWENQTPETIYKSAKVFNDTLAADPRSNSFIVLNHDIHRTTVYNLVEGEIQRLKARGYRPVTVGQCLGDNAANWYRAAPRV